ncbi:YihY/virulence factor BrkB family protein [Halomarina litorea]|uniref:YihY/virulence factor BrkB family protein n=1 Tax=Halomarina litorea TaxID=2961595 RepID=UPI0020C589A9|nr:YihY/virulence factor BrkB family protein [Halomarina sp. BCD28]
MNPPKDLRSVARTAVTVAREQQVTVAAASLGYHAFNTLIPLTLFAVIALSLLGQFGLAARAVEALVGISAGGVESSLTSLTENATGRTRAGVLAFLILAWSVVQTFQTTNAAFERVYGVREEVSLVQKALDIATVTVAVPLAIVILGAVGLALVSALGGTLFVVVVPLVVLVVLTAAFLPLYYVLPGEDVTVREALPGAVFAATTWTLLGLFIRVYASMSRSVQFYGVVGGLLLLLTWLYLGGLVILVGAVLNAVLADRVDVDDIWEPPTDPESVEADVGTD